MGEKEGRFTCPPALGSGRELEKAGDRGQFVVASTPDDPGSLPLGKKMASGLWELLWDGRGFTTIVLS